MKVETGHESGQVECGPAHEGPQGILPGGSGDSAQLGGDGWITLKEQD